MGQRLEKTMELKLLMSKKSTNFLLCVSSPVTTSNHRVGALFLLII